MGGKKSKTGFKCYNENYEKRDKNPGTYIQKSIFSDLNTHEERNELKKNSPAKYSPPLPPTFDIGEIDRGKRYYDMTNDTRGIALILNHSNFKYMAPRSGTYNDEARLKITFEGLGFDVIIENNLKYADIQNTLRKISQKDHTQKDCLVVVIMTHGEPNQLWAFDKKYPVENLYKPFFDNNCPTLKGKPKLFFVQACRGQKVINKVKYTTSVNVGPTTQESLSFSAKTGSVDTATTEEIAVSTPELRDSVDAAGSIEEIVPFSISNMEDLLVMYSTFEGCFSWRNIEYGSWFIQSLCTELDLNGKRDDLLTLLTAVSRRVAFGFESNVQGNPEKHQKKQMPSIVSTLTKTLYFTKKI